MPAITSSCRLGSGRILSLQNRGVFVALIIAITVSIIRSRLESSDIDKPTAAGEPRRASGGVVGSADLVRALRRESRQLATRETTNGLTKCRSPLHHTEQTWVTVRRAEIALEWGSAIDDLGTRSDCRGRRGQTYLRLPIVFEQVAPMGCRSRH